VLSCACASALGSETLRSAFDRNLPGCIRTPKRWQQRRGRQHADADDGSAPKDPDATTGLRLIPPGHPSLQELHPLKERGEICLLLSFTDGPLGGCGVSDRSSLEGGNLLAGKANAPLSGEIKDL